MTKLSTQQAFETLTEKGQLDMDIWPNYPPRLMLTINEDDLRSMPEQVFVLTVKRKDGKECRFSIAVSGHRNAPQLAVRACKTPLGEDSPNIDVDTVKTLAGRYLDYRRDEDKHTA